MGALAFPIPCGSICLFSCLGIICGAREGCRKPQAWLHLQHCCTAVLRCDHSSASSCSPSCNICISPKNFWGAAPVSGSCWASTCFQPCGQAPSADHHPWPNPTAVCACCTIQSSILKEKKPWIPQFQQFEPILMSSACSLSYTCPWSQDRHPKGLNPSYSFNPPVSSQTFLTSTLIFINEPAVPTDHKNYHR